MKDTLTEFTKLRNQLLAERAELETRFLELIRVLGEESAVSTGPTTRVVSLRAGKLTMREAVTQALSAGPLRRKELATAVQKLGYRSKNILNSMSAFLYGKGAIAESVAGKLRLKSSIQEATGGIAEVPKKKKVMSAAAKAKIAAAQRKRWARVRAGK